MQSALLPTTMTLRDGRTATLRHAVAGDAASLVEFVHCIDSETDFLTRYPGEFKMTVEAEREFLRKNLDEPGMLNFIVELEDVLVGSGHIRGHSGQRFAHHAELALAVRQPWWRLGIGRRMMGFMIADCRSRGLHKVWLQVFDHNPNAIVLYESMGFEHENRSRGEVRRADGTYGDLLKMSLFL
jgi:RimJ/RimL family protein N-acetyltransferase